MSEPRKLCRQFEDWLLENTGQPLAKVWQEHLDGCASCREQGATHTLLAAGFATEPVPELSVAFDRRLATRLGEGVRVRRLRGWRLAAMAAYAAFATAGLAWALRDVPLPVLDPSSAWTALLACALVPPSLALALLLSRFMPLRNPGAAQRGSGLLLGL